MVTVYSVALQSWVCILKFFTVCPSFFLLTLINNKKITHIYTQTHFSDNPLQNISEKSGFSCCMFFTLSHFNDDDLSQFFKQVFLYFAQAALTRGGMKKGVSKSIMQKDYYCSGGLSQICLVKCYWTSTKYTDTSNLVAINQAWPDMPVFAQLRDKH